jgi:hypothetical protein
LANHRDLLARRVETCSPLFIGGQPVRERATSARVTRAHGPALPTGEALRVCDVRRRVNSQRGFSGGVHPVRSGRDQLIAGGAELRFDWCTGVGAARRFRASSRASDDGACGCRVACSVRPGKG